MININRFYEFINKRAIIIMVAVAVLSCPVTAFASEEHLNKYVTTTNLNLRTQPNVDSEIQKAFPQGTEVEIIEFISVEWFKVSVGDLTGYMNAKYLVTRDEYEKIQEQNKAKKESVLRNVELTPWKEAAGIFVPGVPAEVFDLRTGLTYKVKSFSNGKHADVEPITKEDTAVMLETYSGKWSWDCRPIIVTVNGHSMAASISGMPHGGGINNSNGMDGQVCIHFLGSTTHNGNTSHTKEHQRTVKEAFSFGY